MAICWSCGGKLEEYCQQMYGKHLFNNAVQSHTSEKYEYTTRSRVAKKHAKSVIKGRESVSELVLLIQSHFIVT
jgi:hypothetical protein